MATQIVVLLLLLSSHIFAYPVFGTKRYGRSATIPTHRISGWAPLPIQPYQPAPPSTPTHFLAPSYYGDYPYSQDYDTEYYYPPEPAYNPYPYYPTDNIKYAVYHSLLPFYYDTRIPGFAYYSYDEPSDPVDEVHDEVQQDEEREERGDSLPVGQETWFENSGGSSQQQSQESIADVNAAFLQNLIISQMYNDAQMREHAFRQQQFRLAGYVDEGGDDWIYGDPRMEEGVSNYSNDEDEDVKELKSLVKKPSRKNNERASRRLDEKVLHDNGGSNGEKKVWYDNSERKGQEDEVWYDNKGNQGRYPTWEGSNNEDRMDFAEVFGPQIQKRNYYDEWIPTNVKVSDRKGVPPVKVEEGTTTDATTTEAPDFDPRRGQKEVPLLRPPMPARYPVFKDAMDELIRTEAHRPKPNIYNTIKKMLNLEDNMGVDTRRPQPKKRFVTNEQALVEQLGGLKKDTA